jgi:hypothetical protein
MVSAHGIHIKTGNPNFIFADEEPDLFLHSRAISSLKELTVQHMANNGGRSGEGKMPPVCNLFGHACFNSDSNAVLHCLAPDFVLLLPENTPLLPMLLLPVLQDWA